MLSQKDKKRYRAIGHHLNPVVTIAGKGLSTGVMSELTRAIGDHELIKIRILTSDRNERLETVTEIQEQLDVEVVQSIGKVALIYKGAANPDPALSNLLRMDLL
ncbi:MAG: ribosome assembly RNA-binding protein YhbY [Gammaproteobacteria bacterium]|jgi:RNA-binding protein|nr:ribosome assembly RNA-binding protein YhbY [Gammaproteobacteria bacterium]|tara:strand:+ start:5092 stop:5403 length:312 start_codon:yes stop_codon:yes gene_type:complete